MTEDECGCYPGSAAPCKCIHNKTDAELSLAVAKVMWPDREWKENPQFLHGVHDINNDCFRFYYRTDDALGKMAVWVADDSDQIIEHRLAIALRADNPHRALAELILEVAK